MKFRAEMSITDEDGDVKKFASKIQCDNELVKDLKNYHGIDAKKEIMFSLTDDLTRQVREYVKSNKV